MIYDIIIQVLAALGDEEAFLPCLHSVGVPLAPGQQDVSWPCNPDEVIVAHLVEEPAVMSFGSQFGGNGMLSKRSFGLRMASAIGKQNPKFLAAHCSVLSMKSPEGSH
jgi:phosphoenolpyruvate carboxykinase (GTP)